MQQPTDALPRTQSYAYSRDPEQAGRIAAWMTANGIPSEVVHRPTYCRWEVCTDARHHMASLAVYGEGAVLEPLSPGDPVEGRRVAAWDMPRAEWVFDPVLTCARVGALAWHSLNNGFRVDLPQYTPPASGSAYIADPDFSTDA